jgi:hypothetical protein
MAACLAETTRPGIPQMRADTPDIRLGFCGLVRLSSTRATRGSEIYNSDHMAPLRPSSTRATDHRARVISRSRPPEVRSSTRATCGPPPRDHQIQHEGPAQPALRRFRGRGKLGRVLVPAMQRETMARHSFWPSTNWRSNAEVLKGRLAALHHLGLRQKGGSMDSA